MVQNNNSISQENTPNEKVQSPQVHGEPKKKNHIRTSLFGWPQMLTFSK